jgi:hypothetical protein
MRAVPASMRGDTELRMRTTLRLRRAPRDASLIAGKPCSATAENRVQLRLKRGCFTTIEGLFYANSEAIFAAQSIPIE